jgi:hypothetical protein
LIQRARGRRVAGRHFMRRAFDATREQAARVAYQSVRQQMLHGQWEIEREVNREASAWLRSQ